MAHWEVPQCRQHLEGSEKACCKASTWKELQEAQAEPGVSVSLGVFSPFLSPYLPGVNSPVLRVFTSAEAGVVLQERVLSVGLL